MQSFNFIEQLKFVFQQFFFMFTLYLSIYLLYIRMFRGYAFVTFTNRDEANEAVHQVNSFFLSKLYFSRFPNFTLLIFKKFILIYIQTNSYVIHYYITYVIHYYISFFQNCFKISQSRRFINKKFILLLFSDL